MQSETYHIFSVRYGDIPSAVNTVNVFHPSLLTLASKISPGTQRYDNLNNHQYCLNMSYDSHLLQKHLFLAQLSGNDMYQLIKLCNHK